jgi:Tfp pilus assembly protein FimT
MSVSLASIIEIRGVPQVEYLMFLALAPLIASLVLAVVWDWWSSSRSRRRQDDSS